MFRIESAVAAVAVVDGAVMDAVTDGTVIMYNKPAV
jgi:hypothetical protein